VTPGCSVPLAQTDGSVAAVRMLRSVQESNRALVVPVDNGAAVPVCAACELSTRSGRFRTLPLDCGYPHPQQQKEWGGRGSNNCHMEHDSSTLKKKGWEGNALICTDRGTYTSLSPPQRIKI
jgi:hypothetical protein